MQVVEAVAKAAADPNLKKVETDDRSKPKIEGDVKASLDWL